MLAYNYADDKKKPENNPFFGFAWQEDIPNPALRQHFNDDKDKVAYYAFKTYGVHIRKNHSRLTWRKMEDEWMENGATPPQPRKLRGGKNKKNPAKRRYVTSVSLFIKILVWGWQNPYLGL